MPEDERDQDDVETGEGSAGEPETLDPEAARGRWNSRVARPESEFDERQRRIGSRRRRGGPDLHAETEAREDLEDDAVSLDPTEPEDEDEE
jgi:hypothetical protein